MAEIKAFISCSLTMLVVVAELFVFYSGNQAERAAVIWDMLLFQRERGKN